MFHKSVIVIPAHNEGTPSIAPYADLIQKTLHDSGYTQQFIEKSRSNIYRTLNLIYKEIQKISVIVVDDGSNDDTSEEVKRFQKDNPQSDVILLKHNKNYGKGSTLFTALEHIPKGIKTIVLSDADMILSNNAIHGLIDTFTTYQYAFHSAGASEPMLINYGRVKQSRQGLGQKDFIMDHVCGMRAFSVLELENIIKKKGYNAVYELLTLTPYGLEIGLNKLFSPIINTDSAAHDLEILPWFLPAGRHYNGFDEINKQLIKTEKFYHNGFKIRVLAHQATQRASSLIK